MSIPFAKLTTSSGKNTSAKEFKSSSERPSITLSAFKLFAILAPQYSLYLLGYSSKTSLEKSSFKTAFATTSPAILPEAMPECIPHPVNGIV